MSINLYNDKFSKIKSSKILKIKSISYIFPIYDEEKRLPFLFKYLKKHFKKNKNQEVIFVDDGSKDNSKKLIKDFIKQNKKKNYIFKIISYKKNKGKGYALKEGVLRSKNEWILTIDVDLSVDFSQLDTWVKKKFLVSDKNIAYFGSRVIKDSNVKAHFFRKFIGYFFRFFQNFIISSNLKDTQCGFKLYKRSYAKEIFNKLQTLGFAHDVELIYLLQRKNIKIVELPIKWTHKSGSKINIVLDSIKMIFEMIKIKFKFRN